MLSTLRYFRDEYVTHIERKDCPAGVCRDLFTYHVIAENCTGCALCVKVCPTGAITGEERTAQPRSVQVHQVRRRLDVCKFDAIAGDAIIAVPMR